MNKNRRNFIKLIAASPLGILIPKSLKAEILKQEDYSRIDLEKYKWGFKDRPWIVSVKTVPDNSNCGFKYVVEVRKAISIRGRITEIQQYEWEEKETKTIGYALILEDSLGERLIHQKDLNETEKEAVDAVLNCEALKDLNLKPQRKKFLYIYHENGNMSVTEIK